MDGHYNMEGAWEYENGFYLTSKASRINKFVAHWELFKLIKNISGDIIECGVFKGCSFIRFATFQNLFEDKEKRKIIGFDAFGNFPKTKRKNDNEFIKNFQDKSGIGIDKKELEKFLLYKKIKNYELIKGDINITVPDYVDNNSDVKIALLHIDVDVYEPTMTILENLYEYVEIGGIILLDDYNVIDGETSAVNEFFRNYIEINYCIGSVNTPPYIIKK